MSYNLSSAINCTVFRNGDSLKQSQTISIPGTMTLKQFLEKCSMKLSKIQFFKFHISKHSFSLGMSAKRIFTMADGEEVTHIHLIAPDENLIITEVLQ